MTLPEVEIQITEAKIQEAEAVGEEVITSIIQMPKKMLKPSEKIRQKTSSSITRPKQQEAVEEDSEEEALGAAKEMTIDKMTNDKVEVVEMEEIIEIETAETITKKL